mgnify:CR=1 FL=1
MDDNTLIDEEMQVKQWYDDILYYVISLKPEYEENKDFIVHLIYSVELKMKSLQNRTDTRKEFTEFEEMWLKMAVMELLTRHEQTGNVYAIEYRENGYSVNFDSSFLSKSLVNMIYPRAKAFTEVEE